jgi:hypothetical protein
MKKDTKQSISCPAVHLPDCVRIAEKPLRRIEESGTSYSSGLMGHGFFEAVRDLSGQLMLCCTAVRGSQCLFKLSGETSHVR